MKVVTVKEYKRKLSREAIEKMRAGGRKGTLADKQKAGKAGWQALCAKLKGQAV